MSALSTVRPSLAWLALALCGLTAWTAFDGEAEGDDPAVVEAVPARPRAPGVAASAASAAAAPAPDVAADAAGEDGLRRRRLEEAPADLFAARSWQPPPPPAPPVAPVRAAPPAPPPPPMAPPVPFVVIGRLEETPGQPIWFLRKSEDLYSVRPGEVIDGTYRVESSPEGSPALTLTYLPLNQKQLLPLDPS